MISSTDEQPCLHPKDYRAERETSNPAVPMQHCLWCGVMWLEGPSSEFTHMFPSGWVVEWWE